MRHRKAVAAAYLLAVVAIGMLAYLAAPHRTALAAGQLAVPQQPRATQLAPTHSQRSAHGRRTPRQVKKHGTTVPTEKMRLLAHGKAARHAALADSVQKRQILLYDSVTVGPYGTYDAQTYYFHPNGNAPVCIRCESKIGRSFAGCFSLLLSAYTRAHTHIHLFCMQVSRRRATARCTSQRLFTTTSLRQRDLW
jgi:hypothetical protein